MKNIERGPYLALQTYSHRSVWLTTKETSEVIRSNPVNYTEQTITGCKLGGGEAKGGSIVVERNLYKKIGGHDPHLFFGYAPEDQMIWLKLKTLIGTIGYGDEPQIPLVHLWHPPANSNNPLLSNMNHLFYNQFMNKSLQEIQEYCSQKCEHFNKFDILS